MTVEKKSWFKTNVLEKVTVSLLLVLISGGTTYYLANERRIDGIEKIVEQQTFSSVEMKTQTETYMASSYTEGKQIEAMNEMTDVYIEFKATVDTTMYVYERFFQNMELHTLRDNAILSLIRDTDSLNKVMVGSFNKMEASIFSSKNAAAELNLREIRKLKALEINNGD